jgi:hypothetical protein
VNVYPFIEAEKSSGRNISWACVLLLVSRAAYYSHRTGLSVRTREDVELTAEIKTVHEVSNGSYGSPRVHIELVAPATATAANGWPG